MTGERDMPQNAAGEARFLKETGLAGQVADLAEPVAHELGLRLVRVKISGRDGGTVQIMAERAGGEMTIEECALFSRRLSPLLDVHDPVPGGYRLEISSPGIDRPLVRRSDFEAYAGREAKIELRELLQGRRRFRGVLAGLSGEAVRLALPPEEAGEAQVVSLPIAVIGEARLVAGADVIRSDLSRRKEAS